MYSVYANLRISGSAYKSAAKRYSYNISFTENPFIILKHELSIIICVYNNCWYRINFFFYNSNNKFYNFFYG